MADILSGNKERVRHIRLLRATDDVSENDLARIQISTEGNDRPGRAVWYGISDTRRYHDAGGRDPLCIRLMHSTCRPPGTRIWQKKISSCGGITFSEITRNLSIPHIPFHRHGSKPGDCLRGFSMRSARPATSPDPHPMRSDVFRPYRVVHFLWENALRTFCKGVYEVYLVTTTVPVVQGHRDAGRD